MTWDLNQVHQVENCDALGIQSELSWICLSSETIYSFLVGQQYQRNSSYYGSDAWTNCKYSSIGVITGDANETDELDVAYQVQEH